MASNDWKEVLDKTNATFPMQHVTRLEGMLRQNHINEKKIIKNMKQAM